MRVGENSSASGALPLPAPGKLSILTQAVSRAVQHLFTFLAHLYATAASFVWRRNASPASSPLPSPSGRELQSFPTLRQIPELPNTTIDVGTGALVISTDTFPLDIPLEAGVVASNIAWILDCVHLPSLVGYTMNESFAIVRCLEHSTFPKKVISAVERTVRQLTKESLDGANQRTLQTKIDTLRGLETALGNLKKFCESSEQAGKVESLLSDLNGYITVLVKSKYQAP